MKKAFFLILGPFLFITLATSICISNENQPKEDFLSMVRYIITNEEINMYKEYPPLEKEEFFEKFWERRDPNPKTFKNEFKEEYFRRIRKANELFKGGIAGWLQDRGRIYILFGKPNERTINPGGKPIDGYLPAHVVESFSGGSLAEKPSETWIYYNLLSTRQIVKFDFYDIHGTGNLKLNTNVNVDQFVPGYVKPNLSIVHELAKQESEARQQNALLAKRILFNFHWDFIKKENKEKNSNLTLQLEIPFERIVFRQINEQLLADMDIFIEIKDANKAFIWDYHKVHKLNFRCSQSESKKDQKWILAIPVTHWLSEGEYSVYINIINLSTEQDTKKFLKLRM
jgi:GWxTD domain-containing protein